MSDVSSVSLETSLSQFQLSEMFLANILAEFFIFACIIIDEQ